MGRNDNLAVVHNTDEAGPSTAVVPSSGKRKVGQVAVAVVERAQRVRLEVAETAARQLITVPRLPVGFQHRGEMRWAESEAQRYRLLRPWLIPGVDERHFR